MNITEREIGNGREIKQEMKETIFTKKNKKKQAGAELEFRKDVT